MITVKEFMDCYNAALSGKQIIKKTTIYNRIEDIVHYNVVDFLNLDMENVLNNNHSEFFVNESGIDYSNSNDDEDE